MYEKIATNYPIKTIFGADDVSWWRRNKTLNIAL